MISCDMTVDSIPPLNTASATIKITRNRKTLLEQVIFFLKFRSNFCPQYISLDWFCGTDKALFPDSCNLQSLYMMIEGRYQLIKVSNKDLTILLGIIIMHCYSDSPGLSTQID